MLWFFTGMLQIQFYLIYTKKLLDYPWLFMTYVPTIMFIGPLVYFYFESMSIKNFTLDRKKLYHLLPPTLILFFFIPFFMKPLAEKNSLLNPFIKDKISGLFSLLFNRWRICDVLYYLYYQTTTLLIEIQNPAFEKYFLFSD